MLKRISKDYLIEFFMAFLIALFIFVSFIRGSVSTTYIILLLFLSVLIYINKNKLIELLNLYKVFNKSFFYLGMFLIWIIIQPFVFEDISFKVLSEVRGQFIVPLLFFLAGVFLVISMFKILTFRLIINIIFYTGLSHIIIVLVMALIGYFQLGYFPVRKAYILQVNEISYFTNLIYAFFLAEVYSRTIYDKKFIYLKTYFFPLVFLMFLFSIYLQGMRWGVVTYSITTLFFILFFLYQLKISKFKKLIFALFAFSMVFIMIYSNINKDKRWNTIIETVNIVFKSDSLYWVNKHKYPCPKLESGKCVSLSNYLRLAQFINGLKILKENPEGIGYSRRAYQEAVIKKYKDDDGSFNFPHSGMINLFIGVGLIGILMYGLFIYYLIKVLLKQENSFLKIFMIFFIVAFHARSFVDMTFMNHNLKVFFFILGIGVSSIFLENRKYVTN